MLIAANLCLICFLLFTPMISRTIDHGDIRPETGLAYQFAASGIAGNWLYGVSTDNVKNPLTSDFTLFEQGRPLGPPHSVHLDIREKGGGRFSCWDGSLIFSSSDGTDPRTNGRAYTFVSSTVVRRGLQLPLSIIAAIADLAFLVRFRKELLGQLRKRNGAFVIAGLGGLTILLAVLAASGLFSPIVVARNGLPKDGALAVETILHAMLGCLTTLGMWAAGAGISRLTARDPRSDVARVLIPAFPIGMVLLAALLAVALTVTWGRPIALALWLACLLPLFNWRPPTWQVGAALKTALVVLPLALVFGTWLGLLWHGPTDTLAGSPTGDLTFYVGNIWSLAAQPFPHVDLGFVNAETRGYFNQLYSALGAALLPILPNFDPFLFLLAGGGASYVLLSALMLHFYLGDRAFRPIAPSGLLLLVLSFVVAARYPYWVVESIPMVFVPALTISFWWMAERGRLDYRWGLAAIVAGLSGSILSKVVSAALLVPLGFTGILPHFRKAPYAVKFAAVAVVGIFGIYSAAMLIHFIPVFAGNAPIGPESYRTPSRYFIARDGSALLMIASAWLIAEIPVALAISFGLVTFLAYSWVFQVNFVCASLVLGLILISSRPVLSYGRVLALAAFLLSLPALILADQINTVSGYVWICCLGGATLIAILTSSSMPLAGRELPLRNAGLLAAITLLVMAVGLVGVGRGSIIVDSGFHFVDREPLTPELKAIWSAVRTRTPQDALVFTDQVDETENVLGGWNTYAFSGQRQIYLSSFVTNTELRQDRQKLRGVLATNKSVLEGSRSPRSVPTQRSYNSFYAVVSTMRPVPPHWRAVTKNSQYALYEILD